MDQDISEVNHSLSYLDPNMHSSTSLFNWISNGSLKSQQRVRLDAYSSHVAQKRVKRNGEKHRCNGNVPSSACSFNFSELWISFSKQVREIRNWCKCL